jgi:hypothetical protein
MTNQKGAQGFSSALDTRVIRPPGRHTARGLRIPGLGRVMFTRDPGDGGLFAREVFLSELSAVHRDGDGRVVHEHDLGSGLVTDVGVLSLANDFAWPAPSAAAINILRIANNHASGTGVTAAAVTDIKLQTPSTFGGQTMVAGVQSLVQASTAGTGTTGTQVYKTVATINYTGTEAVTEWGLMGNLGTIGGTALSSATGSPFTAGSATTGTVTATPLTASTTTVQGQANTLIERTSGTNQSWGLVLSNTTSVATVGAWYLTSSGAAGQAPANTETLVFRPVMWDHKVFSAINVNNGDSIQFTYSLTPNQGG